VTGSGAAVLSAEGAAPYVTAVTTGRIVDMGIKDTFNMGAAMAPAAADVLAAHFKDTGRAPNYYDVIATGDLGMVGQELLLQLMKEKGHNLNGQLTDCGLEIYDLASQDVHAGGSGCGCAAVTLSYFYHRLHTHQIERMLFIPTGALHSVTTMQQGETIPAIAHAVALENTK
jgi:stage V sporulation protein AD